MPEALEAHASPRQSVTSEAPAQALLSRRSKGKGKGKDKGPHADHYYVDGKVYDFKEWKNIHPGGDIFFVPSFQRDISAAVHAYHKDPDRLTGILAKYEVKLEGKQPRDILEPGMNVPPFILPPGFDALRDVPIYDWDKPFMKSLRKKIGTPEMQRKIRKVDTIFDVVAVCLFAFHVVICFPVLYYDLLPWWLLVGIQIVTRTSLAGVGHYHCHRAKDGITDWADCFFDIQYVGASVILADGHVMVHHMYTETPADVKRTVFNFMLQLPRLLRVPLYTLQKFGEFFSGHLLRFGTLEVKSTSSAQFRKECELKAMRIYMLCELFFAMYCNRFSLWFLQFFCTMWINLFQIVASHDFEVTREQQEYRGMDWGIFQIQHALDTYVTGIPWVDIFLSAGLSCHRVHHCLPYQRSGFANIVCMPAVIETCKEFDVEWLPSRNLILDRFLPLAYYYLTAPAQVPALPKPILNGGGGVKGFFKEHMQLSVISKSVNDVLRGFLGESI